MICDRFPFPHSPLSPLSISASQNNIKQSYLHDAATTTDPRARAFASLPMPTRASSHPLSPRAFHSLSLSRSLSLS